MREPADIGSALADYKRAHIPFDEAWRAVVGAVPPAVKRGDSTVARFSYLAFRDAYGNLSAPGGLSRHLFEDENGTGSRGLSRRHAA